MSIGDGLNLGAPVSVQGWRVPGVKPEVKYDLKPTISVTWAEPESEFCHLVTHKG